MKKLTQAMIDEALPQAHDYYLSDHKIVGLACRILPSGVRTYYYRYTSPMDQKRKKIKIGDAKILKLETVRITAMTYALEIKKGDQQQMIEEKKSLTFGEFWPQFEEAYIIKEQKESTRINNKSKITKIINFFGEMKLNEIKALDIVNFKSTIQSKGSFSVSLSYLSNAFRHAEICELRPLNSNPCTHIKGWKSNKRERFLCEEEYNKLFDYLKSCIAQKKQCTNSYYALLCLLLTGQRKNEIVQLKWEDIDLKNKMAILHDSKVGRRTFVLSDKAISIFKEIPRIEGNDYIFWSAHSNSHIKKIYRWWDKTRNKLGFKDVRIHDLRHTFAATAISNGVDLYTLSKMLGHSDIGTTQRYAHLVNSKLKDAANQVFK